MADAEYPRPSYQHHAGLYRNIKPDDLKPWEWSPVTNHSLPQSPMRPVFHISKPYPPSLSGPLPSSTVMVVKIPGKSDKKKSLWHAICRLLRLTPVSQSLPDEVITPRSEEWARDTDDPSMFQVQPHEWKQYGYWARPYLNNVQCPNSPVDSERSISSEALKDIMLSLRGPGPYDKHPELWVPGVKHRSLPPRPTRWTAPVPGEPLPFPWEVQLNPLLQHMIWGPSPLSWYIGVDPNPDTLSYGRTRFIIPCAQADIAQPATWPFLTHMRFNAVAGDTAPKFPWSFTVCNPRGIKCGDVLSRIYTEFHKPVTRDEKMSWPPLRQKAAQDALELRCRLQERRVQDEMRRYDSLGGVMWFRGIEPTVDGEGWMICFGTH